MKDIVIIGGGASGLVAAITAAKKGKKVTIIEKNDKCGKKLLITGNGRCNYFNEDQDISHYHSKNEELIKNIINEKNLNKVTAFFDSLGIIPKIKNGYYYPFTNMAVTIQKALTDEITKLNIEVIYSNEVIDIQKKENYIITTDKQSITAKKLIISTGSKAAPKTGSDGKGYELIQKLNHQIIKITPALTGLKGNGNYLKKWSGIRTEVILSLYEDDKLIKKQSGEIQLTDYGISGIVTFNLSRYVSTNLNNHQEKILINFMPWLKESAYTWLNNQAKLNYNITETLERFIHYKLVDIILKKSNIKTNSFKKLTNEEFKKLIYNLTNFEFIVSDVNSFEKSQTCTGGVPITEVNLKTMESKINKNLYLTGEIIDIDGDCGGYNLTLAWITGIIAGENI